MNVAFCARVGVGNGFTSGTCSRSGRISLTHLLILVSDDRCMGLAASFGFAAKADCFSKLSFFKRREDSPSIQMFSMSHSSR